jgi:hypothetical protein
VQLIELALPLVVLAPGTFGFTESSAPVPGVAVLRTGNTNICLLEKRMGTRAPTHSEETRRTSANNGSVARCDRVVTNINDQDPRNPAHLPRCSR